MGKITWLGHAAFMLEIKSEVFLFDPWIRDNPATPLKGLEQIERADFVLVTHDHSDHGLDDGLEICRKLGAVLICSTELAKLTEKENIEVISGNLGGEIKIDKVRVLFTPASHASSVPPCGFVVTVEGFTVYHAGDTAFFSDMESIRRKRSLDWAFLPIGSAYTMGPVEASWAIEKLMPRRVIPCHYNTFDRIRQDPRKFEQMVKDKTNVIILSPGQSVSF